MALEEQSVRLLAERIGQVDTSRVRGILQRMSQPGLDRETFHDLDTEFHIQLARCSDSSLLGDLMVALRGAVRRPMARAFDDDPDWEQHMVHLVAEHAEIFDCVSSGDGDRAAALVRQHIAGFYSSLGLYGKS